MSKPRNHGLRTTGRPTGNFGRSKVQGKREALDLSPTILKRDNLVIPNRAQAYGKLREAFEATSDPRVRKTLGELLRSREVTLRRAVTKPSVAESPFWDEVRRTR